MDIARLHNLAISSTGFVFDPVSGNSFNTNETGIIILNKLKEEKEISSIAQTLSEEYEIDNNSAEQDVIQLIETLRSYYLI